MARNVEDIIPRGDRRSIRDIPIPAGRKKVEGLSRPVPMREPAEEPVFIKKEVREEEPPRHYENVFARERKSHSSKSKKTLWASIIAIVVVIGVIIFSLFSSATLAYTPQSATLTFTNNSYTAYKTTVVGSGQLAFSVIQLSGNKSANVPASGQVQVSTKASGIIIIYNNSSTASQKLVATTRFETADGHVYRIPSAITVPGKTTVNGQGVPGNITANVVADQAGADYNIGLSDFTLPGFKGDPRFSTIYARSKAVMSGGFVGMTAKVSAADLATAKTTLEAGIKTDLLAQARAQVPADFILFPNLSQITYTLLPQGTSTATTATENEQGNFTGVMFKKSDLATFLATQQLGSNVVTGPMEIPDYSSLTIGFAGTNPDLLQATSVNFQVNGTALTQWVTDESGLVKDLAGTKKSDLDSILKNYPSIQSADATIKPFWKSSFPTDTTKITIEEK